MKLSYINQIKANIAISSNKKTSNILDGTYRSVYKGKSMNFENLREYVINDDVKDIDWKASSRSGTLLIKQYIAEKKHNIMLVMDSGIKMDGDTSKNHPKKDIALFTAGTIGYLAIHNGDYVGMIYNNNDFTTYYPLKYNLYNLEQYLTDYERNAITPNYMGIEQTLEYLYKNVKKRMIIFVITDLDGMERISSKTLRTVTTLHDCLFVNIEDAYLTDKNSYDLEDNAYLPKLFSKNNKMNEVEKQTRKNLLEKNKRKLKKNKINMITIRTKEEIPTKVIELLERHKYANNN